VSRKRWSVPPRQIASVALALGVTVAVFVVARLLGERDARLESEHRADVAAAQIRGRLEQGASLADSLRRFMVGVTGRGVTSKEFASNSSRWLSPAGFPAAAWVEQVPASQRATYERRIGHPIVAQDRRGRIAPAGSHSSYLPATLVSGIPPMTVPGIDLRGEAGFGAALTRASTLYDAGATPLATRRDGTRGLFLIRLAPRLVGGVVRPGFVVVFVSELWLRAAATGNATLQLTTGDTPAEEPDGAATVRRSFTEAGQRFNIVAPRTSVHGAAAVLPWIILGAGLLLTALAGALGVNAARRARAQDELDRIFTLSPDLIAVADFDGGFRRVNPAVEKILGYTEEEFLARPYLELVHPDDREQTRAEAAAISEGRTTLSFQNRYMGKDGSYRVLDWTCTPVLEERVMYAVARDVTERHKAEAELARLAGEQAALRRVATRVAQGVPASELFGTTVEEAGKLFGAQLAGMIRFVSDDTLTAVATWAAELEHPEIQGLWPLEGDRLATAIRRTGRPTREDDWGEVDGPIAAFVREQMGVRSSVGSPIVVEGRLWGALFVHSTTAQPLPTTTESRLGNFTELVGTAVANAQARGEVSRLADEQAALRRVATLVAREAPPDEVFAAVAGEVGRLLPVEGTAMLRYEVAGTATVLATWGERAPLKVGTRIAAEGESVTAVVHRTSRPARIDDYATATGATGEDHGELGTRSVVGCPIVVDGRLWGVMVVTQAVVEPLPTDTESRIAKFTELIATAISNVQARSELAASRARIVMATDEARRRFERDLHDGTQQRLVSLALELQSAAALMPEGLEDLRARLSHVSEGLTGVLDDLRELSRGIHPAILSEGGLEPAVRALARRSAVPVKLDVRIDGRLDEGIEVAAYYVISEALANAAKHAHASVAEVNVDARNGVLDVTIRDDGVGGADPERGSGLVGLKDRVEALGGTIAVVSPPGGGTSVHVELSVDVPAASWSPTP
jgi:PAS domain S-box-containing protein